eukprot:6488198-Amphidinium_carterae.1
MGFILGRVAGSKTTHLGSRNSQKQISQCSHLLQELRLEHAGEGSQINQCGQCHQAQLGSEDSGQNQDGQCSQCEEDLGSIGQIMDGQCSQFLQEHRLGHTEEENQISQCSQCCPLAGSPLIGVPS